MDGYQGSGRRARRHGTSSRGTPRTRRAGAPPSSRRTDRTRCRPASVPAHGEGPRTAPAETLAVLANPATPPVLRPPAHRLEERRVAPDGVEVESVGPQVAGGRVEEPADLDDADVRDEGEALAAETTEDGRAGGAGTRGNARTVRAAVAVAQGAAGLAHDAVVVRRAGRLELQPRQLPPLGQPAQHALVLVRRDLLGGHRGRAPGGDEQEGMEGHGAQVERPVEEPGQVGDVAKGHSRVDLELEPGGLRGAGRRDHLVERPGHSAERVVARGVGAVDRQRDALDPRRLHVPARLLGHQRPTGRRHRPQTAVGGRAGELQEVRPEHRLAAREDENRLGEGGDVVDEPQRLRGRELAVERPEARGRAAVDAAQGTGPGELPGDEHRRRPLGALRRSSIILRAPLRALACDRHVEHHHPRFSEACRSRAIRGGE